MKLILYVLLLVLSNRTNPGTKVNGQNQTQWCVASDTATDSALQEALDWACSTEGGANCSLIQPAGICFQPDTLKDHASFAFNDYWQKFKTQGGSCDFKGSAVLINNNPSHDSCNFTVAP
uniref:Glucan endo-1,3-beta-glucosidase n=1 Tax=Allium sativum TaxID=4682 RepID=A0AAU0QIG1_ALLSA